MWSFLDTRRGRGVLGVVFAWLVVGLLLGVVGAFNAQGFAWPPDRSVLTSDLRGLPPFMAMLVGVPAVVGAALGPSLAASRVLQERPACVGERHVTASRAGV